MAIQFAPSVPISAPAVQISDLQKLAIMDAEESRRQQAHQQALPGGNLGSFLDMAGQFGNQVQQLQIQPAQAELQQAQIDDRLSQFELERERRALERADIDRRKEFLRDPVGAINQASKEQVLEQYAQAFGQVPEVIEVEQGPRKMTQEEYVLKRATDANRHAFVTEEDRRQFVEAEKDAARAEYFEQSESNPEKFTFQPPPKTLGPNDPGYAEELRKRLRTEATRLMEEEAQIKATARGVGAEVEKPRKTILEAQDRQIRALAQAKNDIDTIEQNFEIASETGLGAGPISGFLRDLNPYDQSNAELKAAINAALPNLARGVFGEVGVLTDKDIARYRQLLPTTRSTKGIARALSSLLREKLEGKIVSDLGLMYASGFDVENIAQRFGLSRDDLESGNQSMPPSPEGPGVAGAATGSRPVEGVRSGDSGGPAIMTVTTPEEARQLPANIKYFRAPDGRVFLNPNYQGQ